MARVRAEFYCHECRNYFDTYLRDNFFGNYTIQCANQSCKHHHFRMIEGGIVTEDRHDERFGEAEILIGLESSLRTEPNPDDPYTRRSKMGIVR